MTKYEKKWRSPSKFDVGRLLLGKFLDEILKMAGKIPDANLQKTDFFFKEGMVLSLQKKCKKKKKIRAWNLERDQ